MARRVVAAGLGDVGENPSFDDDAVSDALTEDPWKIDGSVDTH